MENYMKAIKRGEINIISIPYFPELEKLVDKCLKRDPGPSTTEVSRELDAILKTTRMTQLDVRPRDVEDTIRDFSPENASQRIERLKPKYIVEDEEMLKKYLTGLAYLRGVLQAGVKAPYTPILCKRVREEFKELAIELKFIGCLDYPEKVLP